MPIPAYDGHSEESNNKTYLATNGEGSAFGIKTGNESKDNAIKAFLENFVHSETLAKFSMQNSTILPYDYDMTEEQIKSICDIVWGSYEGKTNYNNVLLFENEYTSPSTSKVTELTPETGYKVFTEGLTEGRKKAIEFLNKYLVNSGYTGNVDGANHTVTQGQFILSHNDNPIAMLFDGFW